MGNEIIHISSGKRFSSKSLIARNRDNYMASHIFVLEIVYIIMIRLYCTTTISY